MLNKVGMANNALSFRSLTISAPKEREEFLKKVQDADTQRPGRVSVTPMKEKDGVPYYILSVKPSDKTLEARNEALEIEKKLKPVYQRAGFDVEINTKEQEEEIMMERNLIEINAAYAMIFSQRNSDESISGHIPRGAR